MWIRLQADYDLKIAARDKAVIKAISQIVPITKEEPVPA